jgi:hypothetical protein
MNKRLSKERQALVLSALCEGTPINAVCRMFRADKAAVLRVIRETGEAFADYMDANFRDLPCLRIEMDEQWQYVGCHSGRMSRTRSASAIGLPAICSLRTCATASKVRCRSQRTICPHIHFTSDSTSDTRAILTEQRQRYSASRNYRTARWHVLGAMKASARCRQRSARRLVGSPDLESLTTSHIERAFLSVRQELKRFQRKGLGYSKELEMHKRGVALYLGVYNFVRRHETLKTTPAVAAGVELKPWRLEDVVDLTEAYLRKKEDAKFEAAFAKFEKP